MMFNHCRRCVTHFVGNKILQPVRPGGLHIPKATGFWIPGKGDEYFYRREKPGLKQKIQMVKEGVKMIPGEVHKYGQEIKEKYTTDPIFFSVHGDYEMFYQFDNDNSVSEWVLTTDTDHGEGKSHAEFVLGPNKTGIFKGFVNTDVPKDGIIKNAGFCNIRSPTKMISFKRIVPHDLSLYNHLLVRLRGDGRVYSIMLSMDRYYDVNWMDQYSYPLYTRGGPYWQMAKIPFSKFLLTAKGRVQDAQEKIQLHQIMTFGISIADSNMGPFHLEIDFLGAIMDERHTEKFAYELYETHGSCLK